MQHRIIQLGFGAVIWVLVCFSASLSAQQLQRQTQTQQATRTAQNQNPAQNIERVYDFNALQGVLNGQTQFAVEPVQDGEVLKVNNYGIGDGQKSSGPPTTVNGVSLSQESYFCSPADEEESFRQKIGGDGVVRSAGSSNPIVTIPSKGSFRFYRLIDRWRLHQDGKACFLGVPEVVTNCSRFGKKGSKDFNDWRPISTTPQYVEAADAKATAIRNAFRDRNYIEDGDQFHSARYLFQCQNADQFSTDAFGRVAQGNNLDQIYGAYFFEPYYFDCPMNDEGKRWGFLCPVLAESGAYSGLNIRPATHLTFEPSGDVDPERWNFWKLLLKQAVERIGYQIDRSYWGSLNPQGPNTVEKEMAGILIPIWEILNKKVGQLPDAPFGGLGQAVAQRVSGVSYIRGVCGATPLDTPVAIEKQGNRHKLVFNKSLCLDVMSKKTLSNAHFNVEPHPNQVGLPTAYTSYGLFSDGGTYETLFSPNRGYKWFLNPTTDVMRGIAQTGQMQLHGYGAEAAIGMAHMLCHIHFDESGRSFAFGSPQGSAEETLCITASALVREALGQAGHLRSAAMSTEEYNPDNDPNNFTSFYDTKVGRRFYYRDEPRVFNGAHIGPFHESLSVIAHNLKRRDPETARFMAHFVSMCPFFPEPKTACLNGICQSNPYYVEPALTGIKPAPRGVKGR